MSGFAEDGTAKDFSQLFIPNELFDMVVEEMHSNRQGFPDGLSPQKVKVKAFQKGESKFYRHGNLVASVWKDTKLVCFLSTQLNPVGNQTVNRKHHDGTIIQVITIPATISYTSPFCSKFSYQIGDAAYLQEHVKAMP